MVKPILYANDFSPAVRSVLLVAHAINLDLEIRYLEKYRFKLRYGYNFMLLIHRSVNLMAGEHLKPDFIKVRTINRIGYRIYK